MFKLAKKHWLSIQNGYSGDDYEQTYPRFEKTMYELSQLEKASICVIQKLDGKVLVVDGQHRLIALYLRDGNLRNLKFLITL